VALPDTILASEYPPSLLEPLANLVKCLRKKGEAIPTSWVEEAERGLRRGPMYALLSPPQGELGGLLLVNPRPQRIFCHLHLTREGSVDREGRALVRALLERPPPANVRRLDLTLSSRDPERESALAALCASKEFPFRVLERQKMSRTLSASGVPAEPPLPSGFAFRRAPDFSLEAMAGLDYRAFEASPDRGLVAADLDEDTRIMREMLGGELGQLLDVASPVVVRAKAPEIPVAFLLSLNHLPRHALIADVAVAPELRRRGLGRAVLVRALRGLVASGISEAVLWVTQENRPALQLYQETGFVRQESEPIFLLEYPRTGDR
jgi:hypothetical protein